jgi:hypothetical protein
MESFSAHFPHNDRRTIGKLTASWGSGSPMIWTKDLVDQREADFCIARASNEVLSSLQSTVRVLDLHPVRSNYDVVMLEITGDHIALLGDEELRELVGLLCEAELRAGGLSAASVTWGGDQNASDGGVDVRVELPSGNAIDGFIPRPETGFQVKATDMPPSEIRKEMQPNDVLRPSIVKLAEREGAYIIVSSQGTVADTALENRRKEMQTALSGLPNPERLKVDFYDRNRIATWVRSHSGLIHWVRHKIGRPLEGWQSYGNWSAAPAGASEEYLVDEKARVRVRTEVTDKDHPILEGIERIRTMLRASRGIVRLVGLSGVGKTRFAEALFDKRIAGASLDPALVHYTNIAEAPDPQPGAMLSELIASKQSAILIVDNCPSDLHKRLAQQCQSASGSGNVSLLSIEYDIREDLPDETDVIELKAASADLIESLLASRYPDLSEIDRQRIAEFSGGNARIALALASTADRGGALATLRDEDLFQRLFEQRNPTDPNLLRAAEAFSLVYSFDGVNVVDDSHLARLGRLVGLSANETFRSIAELLKRDLAQRRSSWRAVLPPAIANRLAARALESIPFDSIQAQLLQGAPEHLRQSLSRRLGYLHESPEATSIVREWLSPTGSLGTVVELDDMGVKMFKNVAPVLPEDALRAIERATPASGGAEVPDVVKRLFPLLRALAYEAPLFERSVRIMKQILVATGDEQVGARETTRVFASLFSIYLSGTRATLEQRIGVLRQLIHSSQDADRKLGLTGLDALLKTQDIFAAQNFEFGARERDFGYFPQTPGEILGWYGSALAFANSLIASQVSVGEAVLDTVAGHLRGLWSVGAVDEVERFCQAAAARGFWAKGWAAVRAIQHFDTSGMAPEAAARLAALESFLRPQDPVQQVRAFVLEREFVWLNLGLDGTPSTSHEETSAQMEELARTLGITIAQDPARFDQLLPEVMTGEGRTSSFGAGLAEGSQDKTGTWQRLVEQFSQTEETDRRPAVLRGFLHALHRIDPDLTNSLLDSALNEDSLLSCFPTLQTSVGVDRRGFERLLRSLELGKTPIGQYSALTYLRASDDLPAAEFKQLVLAIAAKSGGYNEAIEIVEMRLVRGSNRGQDSEIEVLNGGRELLRVYRFHHVHDLEDFHLGQVALHCLIAESDAEIVREMCFRIRESVANYEALADQYNDLLSALLTVQPKAALDGLFVGEPRSKKGSRGRSSDLGFFRFRPFDFVEPDLLIEWCEEDPSARFPLAASGIAPFVVDTEKMPTTWNPLALRLLGSAPNREAVAEQLIANFSPISSWGSRADVIEASSSLLDDLGQFQDAALNHYIAQEKERLSNVVEEERRTDRWTDIERDDRFE